MTTHNHDYKGASHFLKLAQDRANYIEDKAVTLSTAEGFRQVAMVLKNLRAAQSCMIDPDPAQVTPQRKVSNIPEYPGGPVPEPKVKGDYNPAQDAICAKVVLNDALLHAMSDGSPVTVKVEGTNLVSVKPYDSVAMMDEVPEGVLEALGQLEYLIATLPRYAVVTQAEHGHQPGDASLGITTQGRGPKVLEAVALDRVQEMLKPLIDLRDHLKAVSGSEPPSRSEAEARGEESANPADYYAGNGADDTDPQHPAASY